MFKSDNASQNFSATLDLYCVWIRATETPGAPLIAVWIDRKMRAFEPLEGGSACVAREGGTPEAAEAFDR